MTSTAPKPAHTSPAPCALARQKPATGVFMLAVRVALGAIFLFAGYMKLGMPIFPDVHLGSFVLPLSATNDATGMFYAIEKFGLGLPTDVTRFLAFAVPWTEAVCGLLLILGLWARAASLLVLLMNLAFMGAIASLMMKGVQEPCTCFGPVAMFCPKDAPMGWCHLIRDAVFAAAAVLVMALGPGYLALCRKG